MRAGKRAILLDQRNLSVTASKLTEPTIQGVVNLRLGPPRIAWGVSAGSAGPPRDPILPGMAVPTPLFAGGNVHAARYRVGPDFPRGAQRHEFADLTLLRPAS
jgi:hypothetical protein